MSQPNHRHIGVNKVVPLYKNGNKYKFNQNKNLLKIVLMPRWGQSFFGKRNPRNTTVSTAICFGVLLRHTAGRSNVRRRWRPGTRARSAWGWANRCVGEGARGQMAYQTTNQKHPNKTKPNWETNNYGRHSNGQFGFPGKNIAFTS